MEILNDHSLEIRKSEVDVCDSVSANTDYIYVVKLPATSETFLIVALQYIKSHPYPKKPLHLKI